MDVGDRFDDLVLYCSEALVKKKAVRPVARIHPDAPSVTSLFSGKSPTKRALAHMSAVTGRKDVETVFTIVITKKGDIDLRAFGPVSGEKAAFIAVRMNGIAASCWNTGGFLEEED